MTDHWLHDNRHSLAFGALIFSFIFTLVIPIIGYLFNFWSSTVSRLLMTGFGGLGTITLALLTFLTLIENRILVQERLKEREKPLQRDMLEKIVWPAIDTLDENRQKLNSEDFNWLNSDTKDKDGLEPVNVGLKQIGERGDPVTSDRFVEAYPEVADKLVKYDEQLVTLDKYACECIECTREPIAEYFSSVYLGQSYLSPVEVDDVLNYLLVGDRPGRDDERPDWWTEHKQEFKRIAGECAGAHYEKFHKQRRKVFNYSNEVRRSLVEVREDIEQEYGIYRE